MNRVEAPLRKLWAAIGAPRAGLESLILRSNGTVRLSVNDIVRRVTPKDRRDLHVKRGSPSVDGRFVWFMYEFALPGWN